MNERETETVSRIALELEQAVGEITLARLELGDASAAARRGHSVICQHHTEEAATHIARALDRAGGAITLTRELIPR